SHAVSRDTEGYIFLGMSDRFHVAAPVQAPYGILVPRTIDGLLVPMAVSSTHIGFQTLRLEPIRVSMGQAAGNAAALCVKQHVQPRAVNVAQLQQMLLDQGQSLYFFKDVLPSNPHFKAIQKVAMAGVDSGNDDYTFHPEARATYGDAARYLFNGLHLKVKMDVSNMWKIMPWQERKGARGIQYCTPNHPATYYLLTLFNLGAINEGALRQMNPDAPIPRQTFAQWVGKLHPSSSASGSGTELTREEMAEIVAGWL
ncbi:MAG TPA: FAD-dependent oxidoreductase, partial [Bryobacteraceae bacterium]